ncbi:hypothetical protein BDZ45DRAFT_810540 [Acephala macrosclerotiorum]|nr:hypothetical protein BDZ45DRAFT_810540 [Acephala macrosclerotiorum]
MTSASLGPTIPLHKRNDTSVTPTFLPTFLAQTLSSLYFQQSRTASHFACFRIRLGDRYSPAYYLILEVPYSAQRQTSITTGLDPPVEAEEMPCIGRHWINSDVWIWAYWLAAEICEGNFEYGEIKFSAIPALENNVDRVKDADAVLKRADYDVDEFKFALLRIYEVSGDNRFPSQRSQKKPKMDELPIIGSSNTGARSAETGNVRLPDDVIDLAAASRGLESSDAVASSVVDATMHPLKARRLSPNINGSLAPEKLYGPSSNHSLIRINKLPTRSEKPVESLDNATKDDKIEKQLAFWRSGKLKLFSSTNDKNVDLIQHAIKIKMGGGRLESHHLQSWRASERRARERWAEHLQGKSTFPTGTSLMSASKNENSEQHLERASNIVYSSDDDAVYSVVDGEYGTSCSDMTLNHST